MKLHRKRMILNPTSALLLLLAFLPVFVYPLRFGYSPLPAALALLGLLAIQLLYNTTSPSDADMSLLNNNVEAAATKLLNSPLVVLSNLGSRGAFTGPGPTRNIQATDSQQSHFYSWGFTLMVHFCCAVAAEKTLHGMELRTNMTPYYPVFALLTAAALGDMLLPGKLGKRFGKPILLLSLTAIAAVWVLLFLL